eukprot:jgi/Bigna1/73758/fgenesh1_pg.26_\
MSTTVAPFEPPVSVEITSTLTKGEKSKFTEYVILVKWLKTGEAWTKCHRFSEFSKLHSTMSEIFQGLPTIPPKTWSLTKNLDKSFVENRRKQLDTYLKALIQHEGVMNTVSLVDFLSISEHVKLSQTAVPIEVSKIEERKFGINQFLFDEKSGAVFTACEEVKLLNRFDAHLSNIRMPWEDQGNIAPVGSFSCWRRGKKGLWELVGTQFYDCPISKILWCSKTKVVYSALANGDIAGYSVAFEDGAGGRGGGRRGGKTFKLQSNMKEVHQGRILCMEWYGIGKKIVTTGNDRRLVVHDVQKQEEINEITLKSKLTALVVETANNRAIVGSTDGKIGILDISVNPCEVLLSLSGHKATVNALHHFPKRRYLFSGGRDYLLGLWSIKNKRDVLMSERIGFLKKGPPAAITTVEYISDHKYIITGHEKGFVAVWNAATGRVVMVFRAHRSQVTDLKHMNLCRAHESTADGDMEGGDNDNKTSTLIGGGGGGGGGGSSLTIKAIDYSSLFMKTTTEEGEDDDEDLKDDDDREYSNDDDGLGGDFHDDDDDDATATIHKSSNPYENAESKGKDDDDDDNEKEEEEEEEVREVRSLSSFLRPSKRYIVKPEEKEEEEEEGGQGKIDDQKMKKMEEGGGGGGESTQQQEQQENEEAPDDDNDDVADSTKEEKKMKKEQVKEEEEEEEEDIFAKSKHQVDKQKTIEKFADLFGTGDDDDDDTRLLKLNMVLVDHTCEYIRRR